MSCQSPTSNTKVPYSLQCFDIPDQDSVASYQAVLQSVSVDASGNATLYDNITLGNVSVSGQIAKSVSVNSKARYVGVFLVDATGTPQYYMEWELSQVAHSTLATSYWAYYADNTYYGISSQHVQSLALGTQADLTYSDRPYYLFSTPSVSSHTYQVSWQNVSGNADVYFSNSLTNLYSSSLGASGAVEQGSGAPGYLLLEPSSFSETNQTNLEYSDVSQEASIAFPVNHVVTTDDGQTLFMTDESASFDTTAATFILREYNVASGTVQIVRTFSSAITCMAAVGSELYIGCGDSVYLYDPPSNMFSTVLTLPMNVSSLAEVGSDYLLVTEANGDWGTVNLYQISTGTTTTSSNWVWPSKTSVWIPSKGQLYLLNDGETTMLNELAITPATQMIGAYNEEYGTESEPLAHPLVQLGSDLAILTGAGAIFRVDSTTTSTGIAYSTSLFPPYNSSTNTSTSLSGAFVSSGSLFVLQTQTPLTGTPTTALTQWQPTAPYTQIATLVSWSNETSVGLIQTSSGALAVDLAPSALPNYPPVIVVHQIPSSILSGGGPAPSSSIAATIFGRIGSVAQHGRPVLFQFVQKQAPAGSR